ncbi:MAG TPA: DUF2782 domain-containing protein [Burkholderiales bacterium]|nr:DUF2782 domain-containing protein [Burkholderiales bacterium]
MSIVRLVVIPRWANVAAVLVGVTLLSVASTPTLAQTRTRPPNLQPVPEPPPPPKGFELDSAQEPQVTIVKRGTETVEEYRLGGRLYMMKVTPAGGGTPYYLVDNTGDGSFARQNSHDTGLRPPMWLIHSF